ncbi:MULTISPECIES: glutaredoxin 3 [Niveibacterium]|uniref:Glutaredoxin n=1 Tax=Niveibacterium microcysteis TaxID=2811415 RepID=A0ABX7M977_9RHOO|nr:MULTISPECIES: glutaredoxin 3 [Niveibacterium]QSI78294.1 glutaredoxin 3 [Niveibacterium microcysteis]
MAKVVMYATAVCPFCVRAEQLLRRKGVSEIEKIRIDLDPAQRDHMMEITGRRTVPQIFIGERHIGGCDDLYALDHAGELDPLLAGPDA